MARKAKISQKKSRRRVRSSTPEPVLNKLMEAKAQLATDLCGKQAFGADFPVPTPVEGNQTNRLKTLVQNAGVDRDSGEFDPRESESESLTQEDELTKKRRKKETLSDEALFKKLKNNVAARSKLSSIHAARSHKYGHVQFGPKKQYKESSNISRKMTKRQEKIPPGSKM